MRLKSFTVNVVGDSKAAMQIAKGAKLHAYSSGSTTAIELKAKNKADARHKVIDLVGHVGKIAYIFE